MIKFKIWPKKKDSQSYTMVGKIQFLILADSC